MEITRETPKKRFIPVIITLQTEEELRIFHEVFCSANVHITATTLPEILFDEIDNVIGNVYIGLTRMRAE